MKVIACVDEAGWSQQTQAEEYQEIQNTLEIILQCPIHMELDVLPHMLSNRTFAIYVFDYGGMSLWCSLDSHYKQFFNQLQEHPNSLFIIWSSFTAEDYKNYITYDLGADANAPNLIIYDPFDYESIRAWFPDMEFLPEEPKTALQDPDD